MEHYRTAATEQREQEQRRHEHQVHRLRTELKQAQLAFSPKQEELTRLNKKAAALATELGSVKQAPHLEREASRNQAKKVERLQAVEAQASVLEAQLVDSRTRLAEARETAARADIATDEMRRQISALEVELSRRKVQSSWKNAWRSWTKQCFVVSLPERAVGKRVTMAVRSAIGAPRFGVLDGADGRWSS